MQNGALDLTRLVTHVFPLEESKAAFELARDRNEFHIKILFLPHYEDLDDDDLDNINIMDKDL
jgi:hypothetical protein